MKSFNFQALSLATGTALAQVLIAIMYVWSARSTAPSDFGGVVAAIALGNVVAGVLDFGSNSHWAREISRQAMSGSEYASRAICKAVVSASVLTPTVVILSLLQSVFVLAPIVALSTLLFQMSLVWLRGTRRGEQVAGLIMSERMIAVVAYAIGVAGDIDPLLVLAPSIIVGTLGAAAVGIQKTRQALMVQKPAITWTNPWAGAGAFGTAGTAVALQQLDINIVGILAGPTAAGFVGAVSRWTQPLSLLASAFSSAAAPFIAGARTAQDGLRVVGRSWWMLALAMFASLALAVYSAPIVELVLGPEYQQSGIVLQFLALGTLAAILNQPLAVALQSRGYDRQVAVVIVVSVIVQLAVVASLASTIGALSAGIAYLGLQLSVLMGLVAVMATAASNGRSGQAM